MSAEPRQPGVYLRLAPGELQLVHHYLDDHYELLDIVENFSLGERSNDGAVVLERRMLGTLKMMADAESFDHPAEFISMCLDVAAIDVDPELECVELISIG